MENPFASKQLPEHRKILWDRWQRHHQLFRNPFAVLVVVRAEAKAALTFLKSAAVYTVPLQAAEDYNLPTLPIKSRKGEKLMTSPDKAAANRQNTLKSTGPKTLEGKAAVRLNAVKHGLLSEQVLLPDEDEDALRELSERLRAELQPEGELENLLVDRITAATWRLRRLGRVEAGIFAFELYAELAERARQEAHTYTRTERFDDDIRAMYGPKTVITDEQKHREATDKALKLESIRDAETATLGQTFVRDANKANAFSKLSRYETTIERSLYKALHELQRLHRPPVAPRATSSLLWPLTWTSQGFQRRISKKFGFVS